MPQWSAYTSGERIKILRGREVTQTDLAHMTGLALITVQKAEQDICLTLPTLLKISAALSVDASVILGQQAPRRTMERGDRAMLRQVSQATHDTAAGLLPESAEPVSDGVLASSAELAWQHYWRGDYLTLGGVLVPLLTDAAVTCHVQPTSAAWQALSDAYQITACMANLLGARDLAYAAVGHAKHAAEHAGDELRAARVESARSWVYLRDGRVTDSLELAQAASEGIEPSYRDASHERLTVYGNLLTHCAVTSARLDDTDRAGDFLSQVHAVGARLGDEYDFHGARFGPTTASTQAVGVNVTVGEHGKALRLSADIHDGDLSGLADAARNRYKLDVALAQADAKMWDTSLDTLEGVLTDAPQWARHQALPNVILERVGRASTDRLRRLSKLVGVPVSTVGGFAEVDTQAAL
ncbi:helix-turn-helix domain-containing protein [Streptomyces sp. 184]|uniref:helix-turn-helix domain-containing protein n=1 Tax=Streptomyces sp. 184 TaxID=1827526 RepID=UPI003891455A